MSKPDPNKVTRAMISPEWAALVRLDTNLAGISTWDPRVIREPRLLIPIDLQALYVAPGSEERFVNMPFALTTEDNEPAEPMPEPFATGEPRPSGVHLHWAMPDALLNGEMSDVEDGARNRLGLPPLPDRWVVLRLWVPRTGNKDHAQVRGWVIESETTRVVPLDDWPSPEVEPLQTGKTLDSDELTGSVGGALNWTAIYDAVENRFAFHDSLADLPSGTGRGALRGLASYVVAGWWSREESDPLDAARNKIAFNKQLERFAWQIFGDREGGNTLHAKRIIDGARRETLGLMSAQRYSGPDPAQSADSLGNVMLGSQKYDVRYSPFAEEKNQRVRWVPPTHLYSSLLHGVIHGVQISGTRLAADQRPRKRSVGLALGLHGDDVAAALASESLDIDDDAKRRDNERILAAFTGRRLDELGTADGVINVEEHEHASGFESRPGPVERVERVRIGGEGESMPAGRAARAQHARRRSSGRPIAKERAGGANRLFFAPGERSDMKIGSPTRQRRESEAWEDKRLGGAPTERSREVPRSGPRYYRPLEPIVAIRNAKRSLRHRFDGMTSPDGRLVCRWPSQVQLKYDGVIDGRDLLPHLPGSGVPEEVLTLARSAVVTDPYQTKWLAQRAEQRNAVPRASAEQRIFGEVALRYGDKSTYSGSLPISSGSGGKEHLWAGSKVTNELRRFSVLEGVDPDPIGITTWAQPWIPQWLEWEVELKCIDQLGPTQLEEIDIEPHDPAWLPESDTRTLSGRSMLNTGSAKTMAAAIDDWIVAETARDLNNDGEADDASELALANIAESIETLDVLSASLNSLQEQLLGFPIGDYGVLNERNGADDDLTKPAPVDIPKLLLNGALRLTRARIVDAFGRVMDLPVGRTRVPARLAIPDTPAATVRMNPRLMRPARWLFRLVDPADLSKTSRPATLDQVVPENMVNPVAGFLLPDHIDEALEFFDTAGNPLGQLMHEPFGGGVAWEIAPGRPGPSDSGPLYELADEQRILGHAAASLLAVDANTRKGMAAPAESESALSALLRAIDTTLWTVDTFAGFGNSHIAGLVGRPIAVVRATLQLDIDDDLDDFTLNATDREQRQKQYDELVDRPFPVRIGELTRSDDGVLGFFVDDDYTQFHVVDKAVRDGALESGRGRGHLAQKGSTRQIPSVKPIDHPYLFGEDELLVRPGQIVRLTILMHPAGKVHLTSGILPRKALQLLKDWTHPGLSVMAPSTRVGPVLIEPGEVRLPKISVFPKEQIWTRRDSPVTWKDDPILAATQTALLPEFPAQVEEGYIRISPDSGEEDTD
jgi:hypothetical protein